MLKLSSSSSADSTFMRYDWADTETEKVDSDTLGWAIIKPFDIGIEFYNCVIIVINAKSISIFG